METEKRVRSSSLKMQIENLQKENTELKRLLEVSRIQLEKVAEQRNELSMQLGTIVSVVKTFNPVR